MNHLALFNGIGGFQLAAHWAGWNNVAHVEIDSFCNKVVAQHFPDSKCHLDIKEFNGKEYNGRIDIISGGFPCQPYSAAGKRKGKEDDRHLWPEMLRTIREVQPSWVVGENVRGLTNWNGGLVFDEVQADLEAEGYEVTPFLLPACAVNAPHRRDRIWFVAYSDNARRAGQESDSRTKVNRGKAGRIDKFIKIEPTPNTDNARAGNTLRNNGNRKKKNEGWKKFPQSEFRENSRPTPNTNSSTARPPGTSSEIKGNRGKDNDEPKSRIEQTEQHTGRGELLRDVTDANLSGREGKGKQPKPTTQIGVSDSGYLWDNFPTQSPIRRRNDGVSNRVDRIKALGNAIVPQVAYEIFKAINTFNELIK